MDRTQEKLSKTSGIKLSLFKKPVAVVLCSFLAGALISGAVVFWAQKQMLNAAAMDIRGYSKLKEQYKETRNNLDNLVEYSKEHVYRRIDDCTGEKCLFEGPFSVIGFGYIEGYYSSKERIDWGNIPVTCDALVTTGGSGELINDLLKTVKEGNTINTINEGGQLMANISLSDLTVPERNLIKNSNINNKVTLKVIRYTTRSRGTPVCTSFLDIVGVQ